MTRKAGKPSTKPTTRHSMTPSSMADDPRPAGEGQDRRGIGADRHEGRLGQRNLPGIAERQVQAHRSDRKNEPGAKEIDNVGALSERRDDQRRQSEQEQKTASTKVRITPLSPRTCRAGLAAATG